MKNLRENLKIVLESGAWKFFLAGTILALIAIGMDIVRFNECRDAGFSIFFCLTL